MLTNAQDTIAQTVPKGGGGAIFEILSDAYGPLAVPQFIEVPELLDYDYQDKRDVKTLHGAGTRPISLTGGKEEITVSLTMAAYFGKMLNQVCYGQEEVPKQHVMVMDKVGYVVPSSIFTDIKIRNCVMIHLGRWDSTTSVKINGAAASVVGSPTVAGQVAVSNGKHTFAAADKGKQFEITFVSNGVTIVQTGRIRDTLSHDVKLFSSTSITVKNDQTLLTRDAWNTKSDVPAQAHYQFSPNGVLLFDDASNVPAGKFMSVIHWTDDQLCTSKIAAAQWPAASYQFYVDPPSAAAYAAHVGVTLLANSGTAMTGVAVGGELSTEAGSPSSSGKYAQDSKGWYKFHSADAGDTVRLFYEMDYYSIMPVCRNLRGEVVQGEFFRPGGVFNALRKPLTRVALTSPLSIGLDQYAVDKKTGATYVAYENAGERIYINAEFETDGGSRIEVKQTPVGSAPILRISLFNQEASQQELVTLEQAMCEGMGIKTKTDDSGDALKFSFKCAIDRTTGLSHAVNTSS